MTISRLLILAFLFSPFCLCSQIPISQARTLSLGSAVTVRGIVTNGGELGKIRYLQDGTAGIAAFPGTGSMPGFDTSVEVGDSVEVGGTLVAFHGLLEINPITTWQIVTSGNPLPAPKPVTLANISDNLESQLVRVECLLFDDAGGVFAGGETYAVADGAGNSGEVYLRNGHPLQGAAVPANPVRLTAILSEYDGFQLLPRSASDFGVATCFYFLGKIEQSEIQTTGFKIIWKTNLPSSAKLRYGSSPALGSEIILPVQTLTHTYNFADLMSGTVYWVQIEAAHNGETVLSGLTPFATQSLSSGQIKLYFNHDIDETVANGLLPEGQSFSEVLNETIARIDAAQQTLDVAMYTNNRTDIANALKQAHARGVRVRYIAALDGSSPALEPPPPFPVVFGNNSGLMHDKFMVIDADLADQCWVMSGSMNWTSGNMTYDYNNTLFIQDQSLARAYEIEFEEMWGGGGLQPGPTSARFGAAKKDNTPHQFVIGGIPVESYFSPSDQVTSRIVEAIETADSEALFALFVFTKNEQADALAQAHNAGAQVRGMINNTGDVGSEFNYLLSQGVNVQPHPAPAILHHKYGIVDADAPNSAPLVVTGSHNWTFAAETENDENTLVIHDADIARLFKAEFEQRWAENSVSTKTLISWGIEAFPNPVFDILTLQFEPSASSLVSVKNVLGITVSQAAADISGVVRLNVETLPPGFYVATIETSHGLAAVPFQKIQR